MVTRAVWGEHIAREHKPANRPLVGQIALANYEIISTPEELLANVMTHPETADFDFPAPPIAEPGYPDVVDQDFPVGPDDAEVKI